jgi:hypothetical protein
MSLSSETFESSNFTEILRRTVETKQTGCLKVKEGLQEGCIAIENGTILHARAGNDTGLHALFQFVGWREAKFEFQERAIRTDLSRDLAVYDPQVLITGIVFKTEEQTLLHEAIPALDAVLVYVGGEGLAAVEVTSADMGLLALADGHRTVRDIAQRLNSGATEVARQLARFRMAGVLEVVAPAKSVRASLAATG